MKKLLILPLAIALGTVVLMGDVSASETDWAELGGSEKEMETGIDGTLMNPPTASPVAGSYSSTQSVTLSVDGAESIRYTTDGSIPTCSSAEYTSAIPVSSSTTIKAISCYPENNSSSVATFAYVISAASSPGGGVSAPPPSPDPKDDEVLEEDADDADDEDADAPLVDKPIEEMTVSELLAEIARITALVNQLQTSLDQMTTETDIPDSCAGIRFDRNLSLGSVGNDVRCLQAFLNTDPVTRVAVSGAGSPGNETNYFGSLTRAAVIKFQEKYFAEVLAPINLTSGTGFVGQYTRAKLNSLLGQ